MGAKQCQLRVKIPNENILESLYKMRKRESVQLQSVSAMYGQESLIEIEHWQAMTDCRRPSEKDILIRKRAKRAPSERILARIRRVTVGILPYVKITNLNRDANSATNGMFRHTEAGWAVQ